MTTKKTAMKTAKPSPRSGVALPAGAHPGNTGGKPGRSGRRPDEFKAMMRRLVNRKDVAAAFRSILLNPEHPEFLRAFKLAAEIGYGRPTLLAEVQGLPTDVKVTHVLVVPGIAESGDAWSQATQAQQRELEEHERALAVKYGVI